MVFRRATRDRLCHGITLVPVAPAWAVGSAEVEGAGRDTACSSVTVFPCRAETRVDDSPVRIDDRRVVDRRRIVRQVVVPRRQAPVRALPVFIIEVSGLIPDRVLHEAPGHAGRIIEGYEDVGLYRTSEEDRRLADAERLNGRILRPRILVFVLPGWVAAIRRLCRDRARDNRCHKQRTSEEGKAGLQYGFHGISSLRTEAGTDFPAGPRCARLRRRRARSLRIAPWRSRDRAAGLTPGDLSRSRTLR